MAPPKQLHLICLQCRFVRVVNDAAEARVYEHALLQVCPLLLRMWMKIDAILDARHDRAVVPHIDGDRVSNMNRLAVVVAHSRSLTVT